MTALEEFRVAARAFLDAHAPRREAQRLEWGVGSDDMAVIEERSGAAEQEELRAAKAWRALLTANGFHWPSGPVELGGAGLPFDCTRAWEELSAEYEIPSQFPVMVGREIVAPAVLAHGTREAHERYLVPIHTGELVGCQLFSEPGAGSDLAGVQTRARRDGDVWRISGQKVWSSNAHIADVGELLARTSPEKPKHRGMTMFLVDMHAPGVEVRPIKQMTGGSGFNEIFLDDVVVEDWQVLGEIDAGWTVARTTLMNERASIGETHNVRRIVIRLAQLADELGFGEDPVVRDRLSAVRIKARALESLTSRQRQSAERGAQPGPEMSIGKLLYTGMVHDANDLAAELLGPRLAADDGEWGTYAWTQLLLDLPGIRIAGGTDEIMRNILSERVLGLPRDPAPAG
ncbi:acyl-CoA dehydrogenase family protein [Solirubrobacter ginsenosidimutans]|uniref:Acyl-CoA dehydrogenase family protein n=1 Tax=Solirubrobacter ginsenosidimutans TaxID=490573 RepID=A0A9X3S1Q8_9ACTN|nr:acyl-CoA dehydrogenase family protein [Solirubrobacter ginsenosidimutans]MDA0160351.1 acyl-CoA dehydrogenase family protein [Solirubrobacter ginsenosidimutans]